MTEKNMILAIYQELIEGKRTKFPNSTWSFREEGLRTFRLCLEYLVYEKLKLNRTEILEVASKKFLYTYKLAGASQKLFNDNICEAFIYGLPDEKFILWEFNRSPAGLWDDECTRVRALRWFVGKICGYDRQSILQHIHYTTFLELGKPDIINKFNNFYDAITTAFPEYNYELSEIEFHRTEQDVLHIIRDFIEVKLKFNREDILNKLDREMFAAHGLESILVRYFNGSVFKAVSQLYPNSNWEILKKSIRTQASRELKAQLTRGSFNPNSKLTLANVNDILADNITSIKELALKYSVDPETIRRIKNRTYWKVLQ